MTCVSNYWTIRHPKRKQPKPFVPLTKEDLARGDALIGKMFRNPAIIELVERDGQAVGVASLP
jgi:hypothetical protein